MHATQPPPHPLPDPSVYSFTPAQREALDALASKPRGLGTRKRIEAAVSAWQGKTPRG